MIMSRSLIRLAAPITLTIAATLAMTGVASAATVTSSGTTMTFAGDATADDVEVRRIDPTTYEFDANTVDLTASGSCAVMIGSDGDDGGLDVECTTVTWTSVVANLGAGADKIHMSIDTMEVNIPATIDGGPGYDDITAGSAADVISSGANGGFLRGSSGNDVFTVSLVAGDSLSIRGGSGNDTIDMAGAGAGSSNLVTGDDGNDTFLPGPANMNVQAGAGDDTINGGPGDDMLQGEDGSDSILGGSGDDRLVPDRGAADGPDSVAGGPGGDTIDYLSRVTPVTVDLRVTTGQGGAGENDTIADDVEHASGGNGADTLVGDDAANILDGKAGDDTIDGAGGTDVLRGGVDSDTINAASDVIPDVVDCGTGRTVAVAGSADADNANLDYVDVLDPAADCETVNRAAPPTLAPQGGTAGDDTLVGTSLADLIFGLAGNDTISGRDGNDELYGNAGTDTLLGENGDDELVGNADNDTLRGGEGNDALAGRGGADKLFGDNGMDDLDGGTDNDAVAGGNGNDELRGGRGADVLSGGAGNDLLVGGASSDRVDGGLGLDWIFARDGARDRITCTKVNLRVAAQRKQRDYVVADRLDVIANRAWCARVVVL